MTKTRKIPDTAPTRTAPSDRSDSSTVRGVPASDAATATALKLWVTLARAYQATAELARLDIARHGLTPAEFAVLEALHSKGPLLLGEVQRKALVSSGGVTFLIDRLEKKGLVERQSCPGDRRARYAALTSAGAAVMRRVFPLHANAIRAAMDGLSASDQRAATALLRRLGMAAAGKATTDPPARAGIGGD